MNTKTASAIALSAGAYVMTQDVSGRLEELIINDDDATVSLIIEDPRVSWNYIVRLADETPVRYIDRDEFEGPHSWDCPCHFCYVLFT